MISRLQNPLKSTCTLLKLSVSFTLFHGSIEKFSCVSEPLVSSPPIESDGSTLQVEQSLETRKCDLDFVLAKVRAQSSDEEVFLCLTHDQTCNTVQPSHDLIQKLLHRFKDDWKSALGIFRWAVSFQSHEHSTEACNTMVDILGKAKKWVQMREFVEKMQKDNLITLNTVAKVMRRFTGAGKWEDAVRIFDELGTFGLKKNTESMNLLLDTLCKENRVEQARSIFLELKPHIPPNAHTFNIFIYGWSKVNRVDEAHWTVQEMKGHGFCPCVISYSTIIQCYCRQSNFGKVYELLDEMESQGCPANAVTYTTIMSSLTTLEEFEEALQVAERMRNAKCKPDTLFYNCLIHTLARAGRLKEAVHVFEVEMPKIGVQANTSTYNSMIAMFCHNNQEQKAFMVLHEMESSELCNPDAHTYYPLLKVCFKRGNIERMSKLLDDMMNKHHLSLDISTYTLLIHGLCRADRCEWAYDLFQEMIGQEITPRYRTCRLLLEEVRRKNMYEAAEKIEDVMKFV